MTASTVTATAANVFARSNDIHRLQEQINEMKGTLDVLLPLLPLVTQLQDFFQQVECEASCQTQLLPSSNIIRKSVNLSEPRLELTRWLQRATETIQGLQPDSGKPLGWKHRGSHDSNNIVLNIPHSLKSTGATSDPSSGTPPCLTPTSNDSTKASDAGGYPATKADGYSNSPSTASPTTRSPASDSPNLNGARLPGSAIRGGNTPSPASTTLSPTASVSNEFKTRFNDWFDSSSRRDSIGQGDTGLSPLSQPDAIPFSSIIGGVVGNERPNHANDEANKIRAEALITGKGAWARAYQGATGKRRSALYLLCMSGIVTTREVSDDLTSISTEHVDDCVAVATEMLERLPHDAWVRSSKEAHKFFEGRFSSLYKNKYGCT